jgi:hypothetical protein
MKATCSKYGGKEFSIVKREDGLFVMYVAMNVVMLLEY